MYTYTVFDLETDGTNLISKGDSANSDILSYSAKKYRYDPTKNTHELIGELNNYFLPKNGAEVSEVASKVNGLTVKRLKELGAADEFGSEAEKVLVDFLNDGDGVVAQNGEKFDFKFFDIKNAEGQIVGNKINVKKIDTFKIASDKKLKTNVNRLSSKNEFYYGRTNKDLAWHYNIPVDPNKLHDAGYDVEITQKVFKEMINDSQFEKEFDFLGTRKLKEYKPKTPVYQTKHKVEEFVDKTGKKVDPIIKKAVSQQGTSFKEDVAKITQKAKTFGDEVSKYSKNKKIGIAAGVVLGTIGIGAGIGKVQEHRKEKRIAEAALKWEKVNQAAIKNKKSGGF